jgi:hypothetical protein
LRSLETENLVRSEDGGGRKRGGREQRNKTKGTGRKGKERKENKNKLQIMKIIMGT